MVRILLSIGALGLLGACSVKTTTVERREPAPATVVTTTPATTTYSTTTPVGSTSTTVVR
jgi:uncharacterized protein YcfJ